MGDDTLRIRSLCIYVGLTKLYPSKYNKNRLHELEVLFCYQQWSSNVRFTYNDTRTTSEIESHGWNLQSIYLASQSTHSAQKQKHRQSQSLTNACSLARLPLKKVDDSRERRRHERENFGDFEVMYGSNMMRSSLKNTSCKH